MSRLPYTAIAAVWHPDAQEHRRRAHDIGLTCPDDVFEQLFHAPRLDALLMVAVAPIDWAGVRWREAELSGITLAQVAVPRSYETAVQSARVAALTLGSEGEPSDVLTPWEAHGTWTRPPVLVAGDVAGADVSYQLLVGRTRLGTLIGLVERGEIPPERKHRVWIGVRP